MQENDAKKMLWELVDNVGTCMMVSQDGDRFRGRPMKGVAVPDQNAIWFITERESPKEQELDSSPSVCLTYTKDGTFASLSGHADIISDRAAIMARWNEQVSSYFPGQDPGENAILIRVTPEFGEFWDTPNKALIIAIKFIEAKITGQRPELGTNEKINLGKFVP